MTIRVIEGFDYLPDDPSDSLLGATGWSADVGSFRTSSATAFNYGKSFNFTGTSNANSVFKFLRGQWTTEYVFGLRLNVPITGIPTYTGFGGVNGVYNITGNDTTSTRRTQWQLGFDQFGTITLINYNNGVPSIAAVTLPWAFVPGNWFYLEVKITPGVSGSIEVRVNTVPVLTLSSIRVSDGTPILPATALGITHLTIGINRIGAFNNSWSNDWRVDDLYFLTADGSLNNDYLGNVRVKYMAVIGDSSPIQWDIGGTSPAPTNWQSVVNIRTDDTTYVTTGVVGDIDLYDIDPNLDTPYVYGIELAGSYKQDDATQRFIRNVLKSGATTTEGQEYAINQSYTYYYDIFELNPDTGLPFTGAEANAVDIGPKMTG